MIALDPDQAAALDAVKRWHRERQAPTFRLFGYAGTGKSTIVTQVIADLGLDDAQVRYAAFSGKAADVMRRKGCANASTIHSLIYKPRGQAARELRELLKHVKAHPDQAAAHAGRIAALKAEVDNPGFNLRDDNPLNGVRLLVIDEVSMVDAKMARDLLSFRVPLLVLGDPGQLPPVRGVGYFMEGAPDVALTRVHRAAAEHPITRMATAIRGSADGDREYGAHGAYDDWNGRFDGVSRDCARGFDQVIVGTHRVRWATIAKLRGPDAPPLPRPGERVMVTVNDKPRDLLNGQQLTVTAIGELDPAEECVELTVVDEDGDELVIPVDVRGFADAKGENEARRDTLGGSGLVAATWACAITCHKSQGSQWRNVLVVDETSAMAWMQRKALADRVPPAEAAAAGYAHARRWLYTAVTRASERITVVDVIGAAPSTIGAVA